MKNKPIDYTKVDGVWVDAEAAPSIWMRKVLIFTLSFAALMLAVAVIAWGVGQVAVR